VNDLYKRFVARERDARHYVSVSRWMTLVVALVAGAVTLALPSVLGAFRFKMELMAGLGLVFVLRWIWWRISAVTEIVALATSIATALVLNAVGWPASGSDAHRSASRLLVTVGASAALALAATFLWRPEPKEKLAEFYRRVRPPGFWGPVHAAAGGKVDSGFGRRTLLQIGLALLFIFACMIGTGKLLLGEWLLGALLVGVGALAGFGSIRGILRMKAEP
jgi:hypothetical protein